MSVTEAENWSRIRDRQEIIDLAHAYAHHFDRNEPESVAALFTADARVDYGPELETIVGRSAIARQIGEGLRTIFAATSHHISNASIVFDSENSASGEFYVYAWHRYVDDSESELWGRYQNVFHRSDERWKIAELVLQSAGTRDFHRPTMHPIGRRR